MTLAIEAVGLVKRFGKTLAVDGVDLAVRPGMVLVRPADPADLTRVAGIVAAAVGRAPVRTTEDPGLLAWPGPADDAGPRAATGSDAGVAGTGADPEPAHLPVGPADRDDHGDFVRYVVSIAMVFAYGSLLGFRIATNPVSTLGAIGLMFVFGFAVGWIWVLLGLYVKSPQSLQGFSFIVMFPLAFGSNVFIQTSTLPGWLQAWVRVNPVTALAGASRGLMLGGPVATPAWHSIAWSIAITVVFAPLAVRRYRHIG